MEKKVKKTGGLVINPHIFRGYDLRGVVGDDLDFERMKLIAKAYAKMLAQYRIRQAVVGHDCRETGEEFQQAVIKGLTEEGIDVVDLGLCLTQMMYFGQYYYQTNGGIMITASHNPGDYNGMKIGLGYSETLVTEEIQELRKLTEAEAEALAAGKINEGKTAEIGATKKVPGRVEKAEGFKEAYYQDLIKRVKLERKFKVVVDASNGTAGKFVPECLEQLGIEVVCQHCELDGSFPNGTPDPTEEHVLRRLGERVKKEGADLGVAYDGDGDRLGVVDEKGRYIWSDVLVAIFADDVLDFLPGGKVVYNVLCSKVVDEVIAKKGEPVMWKTGHSFIKEKVAQEKAVFGGELSGHFFFVDNFYGHDDGLFATLRLLEYLQRKQKNLSEVIDALGSYISSPEIKLGCPEDKKRPLVDKELARDLRQEFGADEEGAAPPAEESAKAQQGQVKVTTIDGVRLDFPDGMLVVRYSQNGPYLTVKFEAKTQEVYDELKNKLREILKRYPEVEWEGKQGVNVEALS